MKKKMSREERAEFKGGKYMGGPAEERAEKKKGKRMAMGGPAADPYGKGSERPGMKSPVPRPGMRPMPRPGMKPPIAMGPGRAFNPNAKLGPFSAEDAAKEMATQRQGAGLPAATTGRVQTSSPRPDNPYNTSTPPRDLTNQTPANWNSPSPYFSNQGGNSPQGLGALSALQGGGRNDFGGAQLTGQPFIPPRNGVSGLSNAQMGLGGMPALQSMKAGGKVKRMAKGGIVKKTKKMADGGMVATPTAQPKPRGMDKPINPGMLNKYTKMKERFPTYSWGNTAPTTRGQFRTMMEGFRDYRDDQNDAARATRRASKIGEQYSKISSRFPGYKPTTEGPVDTKEELRTYMRGMGDYRRANPGIRPVRPGKPDVTTQTKRGGGLARKGVGQALARGGLVKANGCAARGKTKGKMV